MKWLVSHKKCDHDEEIAIVRADNKFGLESYGWGGLDKIIIEDNGPRAVKLAERIAAALNKRRTA